MSEEKRNIEYREDEIDLRKLFQSIGQWFVDIWYWILKVIIGFRNVTIKYKVLILISIVLGAVFSFLKTQTLDPYYEGSFIVKSNYLNQSVAQNIVDNLNNLSSLELADTLSLDTAISNQILNFSVSVLLTEEQKIEFETIKQKLSTSNFDASYRALVEEKLNDEMQSYEFKVRVKDNKVLSDIIGATSDFCREFDYVQKRIEVNNRNLLLKKQKLQRESSKLDSLKSIIVKNIAAIGERSREGSNNVILAEDANTNPLNVFEQDLLIYDQELAIDKKLALQEDFQVFEGSYLLTQPASPSFWDNLKVWGLYFLGGAYAVIFLIQINKYLNKVEKEKLSSE